MRTSALLWTFAVAFYVVIVVIYASVGGDTTGTVLLILAAAFGGLVAGWLWGATRHHDPGPSDRPDADMADAASEIGVFPTSSLRPLGLAAGMVITATGVALGSWMVAIGLTILASQAALIVRDADG